MKWLSLFISTLLFTANYLAQDPNYSQFYNSPIYYNSAMTAINAGTTFRVNARNLWGPIPGRFNTFTASVDAQSVYKMGFGANVYSDVGGEALLRSTGAHLTYSYRLIDSKNCIIQTGVAGGFISRSIDWTRLTFSDQLDETRGSIYTSQFVPSNTNNISFADFNSGLVVRFNGQRKRRGVFKRFSATFGGSVHHLSQPQDAFLGSDENVPMRFIYHGRIQLLLNDMIVAPGFVVESQRTFRTFSTGLNFVQKPFTFGLWIRNQRAALSGKEYDSFIFTTGMNLPKWEHLNAKVQYSYDITISRLKTSSYGTHELSLVFTFPNKILFEGAVKGKAARRLYQCPAGFDGYQ